MTQTYLKDLQNYLDDDPGLQEQVTYEEYKEKKVAPGNTDDRLDEAYKYFRQLVEKQPEKVGDNAKRTV